MNYQCSIVSTIAPTHDCKISIPIIFASVLGRNMRRQIVWLSSLSGNSGILKLKTMGRSSRQREIVKQDFQEAEIR